MDEARANAPTETADVVGPVCESGDFLAKDRALPRVGENDNARPRAVEVLVDGSRYTIVRRRETYEDLVAGEVIP